MPCRRTVAENFHGGVGWNDQVRADPLPWLRDEGTPCDVEKQGAPSTWVTLRACTVLRTAYG